MAGKIRMQSYLMSVHEEGTIEIVNRDLRQELMDELVVMAQRKRVSSYSSSTIEDLINRDTY